MNPDSGAGGGFEGMSSNRYASPVTGFETTRDRSRGTIARLAASCTRCTLAPIEVTGSRGGSTPVPLQPVNVPLAGVEYYAVIFQFRIDGRGVLGLLWTREDGRWKIVSYQPLKQ
jgi:hypothetical protein